MRPIFLVSSKQSNFFFRFEPKQTGTQSVSVVFRFVSRNQKTFFRFVSVFRTGIEINIIVSIQTETTRKNLQKTFSFRGFSNR
jgi:hypothetical protein